jgi:hypothetical protein
MQELESPKVIFADNGKAQPYRTSDGGAVLSFLPRLFEIIAPNQPPKHALAKAKAYSLRLFSSAFQFTGTSTVKKSETKSEGGKKTKNHRPVRQFN